MVMSPAYVPSQTVIVDGALGSSIAACTEVKQQPLSQTSQRQRPLKQVACSPLQTPQGAPLAPQDKGLVFVTQVSPLQQPLQLLAQLGGAGWAHWPAPSSTNPLQHDCPDTGVWPAWAQVAGTGSTHCPEALGTSPVQHD